MRLDPIPVPKHKDILQFYMGKNTPERQAHIVKKLHVEKDAFLAS